MSITAETKRELRELMQREENVVGFSEDLFDGALRVYVEDRSKAGALAPALKGQPIEYVELGKQEKIAAPAPGIVDVDPDVRTRPVLGGISISENGSDSAGTLGYFARDDEDALGIITCSHVLPNTGADVIQPGGLNGGGDHDIVARVLTSTDDHTTVDCAFAPLAAHEQATLELNHLGAVTGARVVVLDEAVRKSGRRTGLTAGHATDIDATVQVGGDTYEHQIVITSDARFAQAGDSGSLVVGDDMNGVGLVMSTNAAGTSTTANRLERVTAALGVTLA